MKRKITPHMADRIFLLMEHCSMYQGSEKIEIMPQSITSGGKAIEGLASELSMLLRGFEPMEKCRLPRKKPAVKGEQDEDRGKAMQ